MSELTVLGCIFGGLVIAAVIVQVGKWVGDLLEKKGW